MNVKNVFKVNKKPVIFLRILFVLLLSCCLYSLQQLFIGYLFSVLFLVMGILLAILVFNSYNKQLNKCNKQFQMVHVLSDGIEFDNVPSNRKADIVAKVAYENIAGIVFTNNEVIIKLVNRTDWEGEHCDYFIPTGNVTKRQVFIWNRFSNKERQEIKEFLKSAIVSNEK